MRYANGEIYEGDWASSKWHGKGTWHIISLDGKERSTYIGDFINSARHGKGKLISAGGETLYDGDWLNDEPADEIQEDRSGSQESAAKDSADLMDGLQELRRRGNSGDHEAVKKLVMIFTRIIEQAVEAHDYDAAKSAKEEGEYWLNKMKLHRLQEDKTRLKETIGEYRRMDRSMPDAIQPCSTCAFNNLT